MTEKTKNLEKTACVLYFTFKNMTDSHKQMIKTEYERSRFSAKQENATAHKNHHASSRFNAMFARARVRNVTL